MSDAGAPGAEKLPRVAAHFDDARAEILRVHRHPKERRRYLGLDVLARSRIALITTPRTTTGVEALTPVAITAWSAGTDYMVTPSSTTVDSTRNTRRYSCGVIWCARTKW